MDKALSLLNQGEWRIIDHTSLGPQFHPLQSFAIDDTLCESVGTGKSPAVARSWVHYDSVILGIQDVRLPYLSSGSPTQCFAGSHPPRGTAGVAV